MKNEVEKQTQFENMMKLSQERIKEEYDLKFEDIHSVINKTTEDIDTKIKISVMSSGTGMSSDNLETMIKNKIKNAIKQVMDTHNREEGIINKS